MSVMWRRVDMDGVDMDGVDRDGVDRDGVDRVAKRVANRVKRVNRVGIGMNGVNGMVVRVVVSGREWS